MNDVIKRLKVQHRAVTDQMRAIMSAATAAGRPTLNADEERRFEAAKAEAEGLADRIDELETQDAREARAAPFAAAAGNAARIALGESSLYGPDSEHSYFRDLINAQLRGDFDARSRIGQHKVEVEGHLERRDLTRTDGAGGEFVPPLWLMQEYAEAARGGRVFANLMRKLPLPPGTDSINIPRVTGGAATGIQTADNAAVTEVDPTTGNAPAPVRTIAGQVDVALQLLEQSPIAFDQIVFADLLADYNAQLDTQLLSGSGASGQLLGVLNTAGILTVTFTSGTPTVAGLYPRVAEAISLMASQRKRPPEAIVMHPRRWAWMLAALDGQQRPLVVPAAGGPQNAAALSLQLSEAGPVGTFHGLPVHIDANVPITLGAGTNEDRILLVRGVDHPLLEGGVRTRVLPEVGSGTLTVRLQLYAYAAFTAARFPASTAVIAGTGLIAPTF